MKPSERIKEIAYGVNNNYSVDQLLYAALVYLDEEWAKNIPPATYGGKTYYPKCEKCGSCSDCCGHK